MSPGFAFYHVTALYWLLQHASRVTILNTAIHATSEGLSSLTGLLAPGCPNKSGVPAEGLAKRTNAPLALR